MFLGILESVVSGIIVAIALETLKHRVPRRNSVPGSPHTSSDANAPLPYPIAGPPTPEAHPRKRHPGGELVGRPHTQRYPANPYHPNPPQPNDGSTNQPVVPRRKNRTGPTSRPNLQPTAHPAPSPPVMAQVVAEAPRAKVQPAPVATPVRQPSRWRTVRRIAIRIIASPILGFFWGSFTVGFISGLTETDLPEYGTMYWNSLIAVGTIVSWASLTFVDYLRDTRVRRIAK